nr:uncharacterized protein LOC110383465 [Helicoverpa armigera]
MVKHKEDSESEDADAACEPRFRVRVCMQRVFRDERARAYVCVSPRRRVAWLQRRLRRLFRLPPHRLLSRGHLLPPDEPLALLDRDDPVEVVPVSTKVDTVPAEDVLYAPVDAVPMATGELERSPSPDRVDVLTETKRQALLMLEQYSAKPASVGQDAPDGQDTPDGQDASSAPDGQDAPGASDDCDAPARPRRRRVRRRRRVAPLAEPAPGEGDWAAPGAGDCMAPGAGDCMASGAGDCMAPGVGDCAAVLRNELQPRAPRVVRPLPPAAPLSCLALPPPIADFT